MGHSPSDDLTGSAAPSAPDARFRRDQHVRSRRDFERAWRHGGRARGELLKVVAVPNELGVRRLGLSVGRAIWKRAVRRNRLRRLFREAFRLSQAELPAGFDLILVPARPRLECELARLRTELVELARLAAGRALEKRARERRADAPRPGSGAGAGP